ncbi:hypothetical protein [uncultured Hyphomonas sp.]|jgi:hypothetical protein|uniref:hypothetical protein n=1 Tax=uncultured Hyphomonas sp. TaxID=225298 RepID=UPI000C53E3B3|nr:hypothetical protein [Hyphomonadaceae bacterium]MBL4878251.1 hypothetical protein [Hyphomonas sp.]|tara:strand:- start:66917 stop:67984 length:1068 start_codon:yes stop_codon:yes gene_type:complete
MPVEAWFTTAESWFEANVVGATELATFGFVMLCVLAAALVILAFSLLGSLLKTLRNASGARSARSDKTPGYRILVARPSGKRAGRAWKWLLTALDSHLSEFNFGAPLKLFRTGTIRGGMQTRAVQRARRRLEVADADMLVWADRTGRREDGFVIHGLSRGGGLTAVEARSFTLVLPGKMADLEGQMPRVAAYLLARELQPALAHPQSFRAEKMKTLADALSELLAESPALSVALRSRIEADFCASSVHVAEQSGDMEALDHVIMLRRIHLEDIKSDRDTSRAVQAHMDLGRALLARATKQFDRKTVEEAISHLSKVIEALQADPTIKRAQAASDAMYKAQNLLETRKRFAVNFGG